MPILYATGSHWNAFGLAFLSGIAEPIGALLGYIIIVVLQQAIAEAANGVIFGFVGGMMIYISVRGSSSTDATAFGHCCVRA